MGLPNKITSETTAAILSEKDLHAMLKCDFSEEHQNKEKSVVSLSVLKIKFPSAAIEEKEDGGGCITPKAVEQEKIVPLKCPPPPRKPKSAPSTKRKAQRVLLDLSDEIESLFPSNILRDFMCGKIKKVRKESSESL